MKLPKRLARAAFPALLACALLLPAPEVAAKAIKKYGITGVAWLLKDSLKDCQFLGEIEGKSRYGGQTSASLGEKGAEQRLYKKAHKLGATHLLFYRTEVDHTGSTRSFGEAYRCGAPSSP